ncbi:golgin subfamily A member 6-like protein 26 [Agelaius tricolor]|uniref:golgin subfamily A member 6-like protein 26 n=1 Tax=Agelaius tricolor TaxID=9191 RepID=UPI0039F1C45B
MNRHKVSGSRRRKMWATGSLFGDRKAEVPDTPDISGSSKGYVWHTPSGSGSSRQVWWTSNISGSRGIQSWHVKKGKEVLERKCEDTDPIKTTAEGSRYISDTSRQPSAYGDQTSNMKEMFEIMKEMYKNTKEVFEMMTKMDNKITNLSDTVDTLFHLLDSHVRELPEKVIKILHKENEENEKLKEKNKKLEERIQKLLAKAMAMHQHSEDINDPSRLSAVLERYEILRLQEWEKVRCSMLHRWTYEEGSDAIKKVFDACEKDIQQRREDILKVLYVPPSNKVMMHDIMKLLRQHYHQNWRVYNQIVQEADIHERTENEKQFLLQCCQIYCLLLLQDPPVKAEWSINSRHVEHVDKKDVVYWQNASFLWPIMKCGEEIIVKGVVWDQRKMT